MNDLIKSTAKFAIGTCVTLCAATVAAYAVVGTDLGRVITAGFKGAKGAIKEELSTQRAKLKSADTTYIKVVTKDFDQEKNTANDIEN